MVGTGEQVWGRSFFSNLDRSSFVDEPPYSKLGEVVGRIAREGVHTIFVAPRWPRRLWYRAAEELAVAKLVYPEKIQFFLHHQKRNRTSLWPVTVFLLCGHKERCSLDHFRFLWIMHCPMSAFAWCSNIFTAHVPSKGGLT